MNIQDECSKIHSKYGISEMANYKIQLLFETQLEEVERKKDEEANKLLSALEQIGNAPNPFNIHEFGVFVYVAKKIANDAVSFYNAT